MSPIKKKTAKKPAKTSSRIKNAAKKAVKKVSHKKETSKKATKKTVVRNAKLVSRVSMESSGGPQKAAAGGSEKALFFKAELWNRQDNPEAFHRDYCVEYYDVSTSAWVPLVAVNTPGDGTFQAQFSLSAEAVANDPLAAKIDAVLAVGAFPGVRLTLVPPAAGSDVVVIAGNWQLFNVNEIGSIGCHFGAHWIVEGPVSLTASTSAGAAKSAAASAASTATMLYSFPWTEPGKVYHDAMLAAINVPENFLGYDPTTMDVVVFSKGSGGFGSSTEMTILQNQIDTLETQFDLLTAQHEALLTVVTSKEAENADLRTQAAAAKDEIEALTETLDLDGAESASINDVYTKLVNEVKSASEALTTSGYKLDNMSFNLKTFATNDASGTVAVKLVNTKMAQTSRGEAISSLTFDIIKDNASVTLFTDSQIPNLLGLTETVARMKLQSYGLKMKPIYQTTSDLGISIGQSFKQSPAPGTTITAGDIVTVIFSKE